MGIKEFAEEIKVILEERTGKEVRVNKVAKNNGVELTGLLIVEPEVNITPTIYLEHFLERYEEGTDLEDVAECIYRAYMREKVNERVDMSWFRDFEKVRGKVAFKLINYEKNNELLEQIPHTKVLDLVKVYYVIVETEEIGRGTILIHNSHCELWGIRTEQLDKVATENTPKLLPAVLDTMSNVVKDILGMGELDCEECGVFSNNMYIMSNSNRVFGAAALCYKDAIRDFASEVGSDIVILPSSVHELILIKCGKDTDYSYFKELVPLVNSTELQLDEVLSDSVYVYHRDTDSITIA